MSVAALDTHQVVKTLRAVGFSEEQAEAVTQVVRDSQNLDLSNLATKADLTEVKAELKTEIAQIKSEMATKTDLAEVKAELKTEIAQIKSEMATKTDLAEVKAELKTEIAQIKSEMATKTELAEVKANMATKTELAEVKANMATKTELAELKANMAETKVEIIKWVVGMAFAQAGLAVAILRFMR